MKRRWIWLALLAGLAVAACAVMAVLYLRADAARLQAEQQAYVAGIAAAAGELQHGDARRAAARLAETPPAHRRWEWHHLLFRADESVAVLHGYPPASPPEGVTSADARSRLEFEGQDELIWWDGEVVHVWERAGYTRRATRGFRSTIVAVDVHGRKALALPDAGQAAIVDLTDGRIVARLQDGAGQGAGLNAAARALFAPAGDRLFAATVTGALRVFDAASGAERAPLITGSIPISSMALDTDGVSLVVGFVAATPAVLDVNTGTRRDLVAATDGAPVLDASAGLIVTGGASLRVWRAATGDLVRDLPIGQVVVQTAVLDRSGTRLAVGTDTGDLQIWDVPGGAIVRRLHGHTAAITQARFSPDSAWLLTAQQKAEHVRLWNVVGSAAVEQQSGPPGALQNLTSFGGTSHLCVSGSDGLVRIWTGERTTAPRSIAVDDSEYGAGAGRAAAYSAPLPAATMAARWRAPGSTTR